VARIKEGSPLLRTPSLTRTGLVIGTPDYMSPEQAQGTPGSELDGRSDLYSLGIVLYEMLTSELPFRAETPVEMLFHHVQSPPRNPRELVPSLPLPVVTLILRALEKQPAKRFPSAAAMRGELEAVAQELTAPTAESPSTALYGGSPQPQSPASTPPGAAGQAPTVRPEARGVAPAARRLSPKPQPPLQASQTLQQSRGRILAGLAVVIVVGIMLVAFRQLRSRSESPPTPPIAGEAVPEPTPSPSTQPVPPTPATGLAEPTLIPPAGEGHQAHPTASPDQIQQLLRQGWLALERGDPEAARRAFEKVLELEPTNQSAEQALRLLEPRNQRDKQTRALFQDARSALNRGDFESAARHFKAILALDPTNQLAQRGLEKARQARTSRPEPRRRRSD
jgi:serine/threonine protein kinase